MVSSRGLEYNGQDWDNDDKEQRKAEEGCDVEANANTSIVLLRGSICPHCLNGQDESWDSAAQKEDRGATEEQHDDGEHKSAHCQAGVACLWVRHGRSVSPC